MSSLRRLLLPSLVALLLAACGDDDAPADDAGTDPGSDATTDDASTDPGEDTSRDVGEDTTPDAGEDTTPDAGEDTTPDVDEDTTLDVVEDTTPDVGEDTGDVVEDAADVSDDATDAVDNTTDVTPDTSLDADAGDTGEVIITPVERSADEDGARIETEAATLQIPPEALTTEVAVTIDNAEEVTLPPNVEPAGAILEFGPPGTVFERPVRITMSYDGSPNTVIWWSNQDGPGYSPLSTVVEGDTLSAWVTHFSEGFPGRDVSPACADVECSEIPSTCVGTTLLERGDATCSDGVCDAVIEEFDCADLPRGSADCVEGACLALVCDDGGWVDCDGEILTGCEVNTNDDPENCGSCGVVCGPGVACVAGVCEAPVPECGDGVLDAGEECDDGNSTDGDGCSSACLIEAPVEDCFDGIDNDGDSFADCADRDCVDELICGAECDAGFADCNGDPGDGCEAEIATDEGNCGGCGIGCNVDQVCVDSECLDVRPEICDNFEEDDGDDLADCDDPDCFDHPACVIECGDGVVDVGEECDDGNTADGDGCSGVCLIEAPACGDGVVQPGEECDDGNAVPGDGCSEFCTIESLVEICDDFEDNDGNGFIDCEDVACADDPVCLTEDRCDNGFDDDRDGLTNCDDPDCAADPVCDCPTPNDCGGCGAIEFDGDAAVTEGVGEGCVLSAFPFPEAGVFLCTSGTSAACFDPETLPQPEVCGGGGDEDGDGLADCDDPECSDAPECCLGNACGGCSPLAAFPGESCGEGVYVCDGSEAVACTDLCFGVTCDDGGSSCLNDTLITRSGSCVDGVCEYEEATVDCADGGQICSAGACTATCEEGATRSCYDGELAEVGVGFCSAGVATCAGGAYGACGGQVVSSPEACEDGFDNDCDGLADCEDADCQNSCGGCGVLAGEPGTSCGTSGVYVCDGGGTRVTCQEDEAVCGDGELQAGEICDDGNTVDGDGCSSTCTREVEDCSDGSDNDGDGDIDCDDDDCFGDLSCALVCDPGFEDCNGFAGDGCETATTNDPDNCGICGLVCASGICSAGVCEPAGGFCGDGVVDPGEECDDGNASDGDGCSAACTSEGVCGDGVLDPGEECDDGNASDGDGCSAACTTEPGGAEVCDDLEDNDGDSDVDCDDADCAAAPNCTGCGFVFEDCNGDPRDGCEANLFEDAENCGGCGFACAPGGTCVGGSCE